MNDSKHQSLHYDHVDRDMIDHILNKGISINAIGIYHGRKDFTLLHAAVANSDEELVKYLLSKNVDIKATTSYKETALHIAAERNLNIVNLLIKHGAEISAIANYGFKQCWTPLHCAIRYRNEDIAEYLLNKGAQCNVDNCECILHFSVRLGMINIVELLFKHYGEIRLPCICQDHDTPSLLYFAVENDYEEIVKFLLNKYNNVRTMIKNDELILHQAVKNNNYNIVKELLNANVDINVCDKNKKETALSIVESVSISNLIKRHILKLKVINYYVNEENLKNIRIIDDKLSNYLKECEEELKAIKLEKIIDSNVAYYNILNKNIHQLSIYMTNEKIRTIVSDKSKSDEIELKYPIYGPIIINRLREGLIRKNLTDKIKDFIFDALSSELPDVFIRQIFSYLSNNDMEELSLLFT